MDTSNNDNKKEPLSIPLVTRVIVSLVLSILGYNISRTTFFREYPLFGVNMIGELMSLVVAGIFGYFALPDIALAIKEGFEKLLSRIISDIVSRFWEEQTSKIQEARRQKQKQQAEEEKNQFQNDLTNALLIDTSVLVDGRILDIVKTGFLNRTLVVSENVLEELQLIADSSDKMKRQRGRRGLDVAKKLKKYAKVISPSIKGKKMGVDKTLVGYAKENGLQLMTLDFNLNKVADVLGIKVLNINELINALKTVLLPGETTEVEIIQEGKEKQQGVGYLNDGTMIVVSRANDKVGQVIPVQVKKVIQSAAGKIVFCDLAE